MYTFNIGDMVELNAHALCDLNSAFEYGLKTSKIYQIVGLKTDPGFTVIDVVSNGEKFENCLHVWFKPAFTATLPVINKYDEAVKVIKQMYKDTYLKDEVSAISDHKRQILREVLAKAFGLYPREETNIVFSTSPEPAADCHEQTATDSFDFKALNAIRDKASY